jgi:predicted proteasome-type protease
MGVSSRAISTSAATSCWGADPGERHRLFHIYPEGNFIEASADTPYFQIGESKYGKPIIDRIIHHETPLQTALQCALISIDSTLRSNLSVGLPLDALVYHEGSFSATNQHRITEQNPHFVALRKAWGEGLQQLFQGLPTFPSRPGGGAKALSRSFLSGYSGCLPFRWSFPCAASTSCSTAAG